jgi:hypothetical protein
MKRTSIFGAMALAATVAGTGVAQTAAAAAQEKVTLTGCAVKGSGDGDGLMGQLVEITGEVEGDVKRGEIEIERENGMIELEIKADGRKANVKLADVPSAIGTSGSVKDAESELPYVVRKLDVKSAKSIAPTCK